MAASLIKSVKILAGLAVIAALALFAKHVLQATAKVVRVSGDRAVNIVPGSLIVQAEFAMELKSERGGRVVKSELDPGKSVKKGDLLLQIDPTDLELEIERAEADLEAAKKRIAVGSQAGLDLDQAKADFVEVERIFKEGGLAEAEFNRKKRNLQSMEQRFELEKVENEARIQTLSLELKTKLRQREKMTIYADFDGVVSTVYSRIGDLIGGGAPLATLISTNRTVEARISEENFAGIRVGHRAIVRLLGQGGRTYEATVSKILPTADPVTQRYIVHLNVKAELEALVPGSTGDVTIILAERQSPVVVPRHTVYNQRVLAVRDGRVVRQLVTPGFVSLERVEILEGLSPGELIITEELDQFREGQRVHIKE